MIPGDIDKLLKDLTGAVEVEVTISHDAKTLWVNTELGCVLRICKIEKLILDDRRKNKKTSSM